MILMFLMFFKNMKIIIIQEKYFQRKNTNNSYKMYDIVRILINLPTKTQIYD